MRAVGLRGSMPSILPFFDASHRTPFRRHLGMRRRQPLMRKGRRERRQMRRPGRGLAAQRQGAAPTRGRRCASGSAARPSGCGWRRQQQRRGRPPIFRRQHCGPRQPVQTLRSWRRHGRRPSARQHGRLAQPAQRRRERSSRLATAPRPPGLHTPWRCLLPRRRAELRGSSSCVVGHVGLRSWSF